MFREDLEEIADKIHQQGLIIVGGIGLLERTFSDEGRFKKNPNYPRRREGLPDKSLSPTPDSITPTIDQIPPERPNLNFPRDLKRAVREEQAGICLICGQPRTDGKLQVHHRVMKRHFAELIQPVIDQSGQEKWKKFITSKENALGACPGCHKVADRLGIKNHEVCDVDLSTLPQFSQVNLRIINPGEVFRRKTG